LLAVVLCEIEVTPYYLISPMLKEYSKAQLLRANCNDRFYLELLEGRRIQIHGNSQVVSTRVRTPRTSGRLGYQLLNRSIWINGILRIREIGKVG
jgi:hypothetical protein